MMKIGMFDSGVGGLSVLKEFLDVMPYHEYIYYGDTKRVPYGSKSKEELLSYSEEIIDFLLTKKVDIIIIACNTISALCLKELRNKYDISLISVIEPTLDYIKEKKYTKLGLIATVGTISSKIYPNNLRNIKIIDKSCPLLVPIIEEHLEEHKIMEESIKLYLSDLKKHEIEALILGCTHYAIIKKQIKACFDVELINPDKITAKYALNLYGTGTSNQKIKIYFSKNSSQTTSLARKILSCKYFEKCDRINN